MNNWKGDRKIYRSFGSSRAHIDFCRSASGAGGRISAVGRRADFRFHRYTFQSSFWINPSCVLQASRRRSHVSGLPLITQSTRGSQLIPNPEHPGVAEAKYMVGQTAVSMETTV